MDGWTMDGWGQTDGQTMDGWTDGWVDDGWTMDGLCQLLFPLPFCVLFCFVFFSQIKFLFSGQLFSEYIKKVVSSLAMVWLVRLLWDVLSIIFRHNF